MVFGDEMLTFKHKTIYLMAVVATAIHWALVVPLFNVHDITVCLPLGLKILGLIAILYGCFLLSQKGK